MSTKVAVRLYCAMAAALALALSVIVVAAASPPADAAVNDVLPDLRMAQLDNIQIKSCTDTSGDCASVGQRQLRFDALIVNVGPGAFELRGERASTENEFEVTQHIYNRSGGKRDRPTTATMFYAGDDHNHWHVKDLAEYKLLKERNNKRSVVRTDDKVGFCFGDNHNFGSTQEPTYTPDNFGWCANNRPDALGLTMGISRGWGDLYPARQTGQYVDITGLADGRYRLKAKADAGKWFKEKKEKNNATWADIQISGESVSVIGYGPSAQPVSN